MDSHDWMDTPLLGAVATKLSFIRWAFARLTPLQNSTGVVVTSCACTRMSTHTHTHRRACGSTSHDAHGPSELACQTRTLSVARFSSNCSNCLPHRFVVVFNVFVCVCVGIYGQRNFKTYLITFIFYDKNDSILKWYFNKAPLIIDGRIGFLSYLQKEHWGCIGGKGWEFGVSSYQLLHLGWINNTVLLCTIGNYLQYPEINHNGKNIKYNVYI